MFLGEIRPRREKLEHFKSWRIFGLPMRESSRGGVRDRACVTLGCVSWHIFCSRRSVGTVLSVKGSTGGCENLIFFFPSFHRSIKYMAVDRCDQVCDFRWVIHVVLQTMCRGCRSSDTDRYSDSGPVQRCSTDVKDRHGTNGECFHRHDLLAGPVEACGVKDTGI